MATVARVLPRATWTRGTGAARRASRVPFSFSPAVASTATTWPPERTKTTRKKGRRKPKSPPAFSFGGEASTTSTAKGERISLGRPARTRASATWASLRAWRAPLTFSTTTWLSPKPEARRPKTR